MADLGKPEVFVWLGMTRRKISLAWLDQAIKFVGLASQGKNNVERKPNKKHIGSDRIGKNYKILSDPIITNCLIICLLYDPIQLCRSLNVILTAPSLVK